MRKDNRAMRLSEALRKAKARGWAPTPIREAVVAGRIASYRSSDKGRAWYFTKWEDVVYWINGLQQGEKPKLAGATKPEREIENE